MTIPAGGYCLRGLIPCCLFALASGCAVFGLIGHAMPDPTVDARYKGLAKQNVAIMVWTDRAMSYDWPTLQLDLTRGIQTRLGELAGKKGHPKELEGTTLVPAESVVRYQQDHPESDVEAVTDVAPRLNIDRLIYIEVQQFSTRPEESLELYRGSLTANVKVIEVVNGKARQAFEDPNVRVVWPPKSPDEGSPGLGDADTYERTLVAFTTEVVNEFVPHVQPRE